MPSQYPLDVNKWGWSFNLNHFFRCTEDRLFLDLTFVQTGDDFDDGWDLRPILTYDWTDLTKLYFDAHFFNGYWRDLRGQWRNNDEIELGVRWNF